MNDAVAAIVNDTPDMSFRVTGEIDVRCRKCDNCLKARAALWRGRARTECQAASRTWFGTLTLTPEQHFRTVLLADRILRKGGERFEDLSSSEQFAYRHKMVSAEITLWLKRIRKESGASIRFCLVAEAHKSGLPHYHMLVHETPGGPPIRHRTLSSQWKLGFSNFKLCEADAVTYVTKYLAKASIAKVRASTRYGSPPTGIIVQDEQCESLDPMPGHNEKRRTF